MTGDEAQGEVGDHTPDDIDSYDDPASIEAGRLLFAQASTFRMSASKVSQLPPAELPEICFAGRSNVGKSSLLNTLTNRDGLARTSNTPGRTQTLNLFDLGGRLTLVDLPGYGFAKAPKDIVETWGKLVQDYLRGRPNLVRVCVLIDSRHGIKPSDEATMTLLGEAAVPYQAVLTKTDLISGPALEQLEGDVGEALRKRQGAVPGVLSTSSRHRHGMELLRAALAKLARPVQTPSLPPSFAHRPARP